VMIVGTGAMACLFAARLVEGGSSVTMLGTWQEGLEILRQEGVRLQEMDGRESRFPVQVTMHPEDCRYAKSALVLVKSWQTERAARQLAVCLDEGGMALTLQNGLGNREALTFVLGAERVALGVTTAGASLVAPGTIRVAGNGKVILGAHPRLETLADCLHTAGFSVEFVADPESLLWGKLVVNAAINPLTALLRIPNGELLTRPSARQLMIDAAREAALVAKLQDIKLPYPDPVKRVEEVARETASNLSSMLQDVLRGAPTEIEAINGAIMRKGVQLGVPTPVNAILYQMVKGLRYDPSQENLII
jgi:2-dehydropantoate 2-reductase